MVGYYFGDNEVKSKFWKMKGTIMGFRTRYNRNYVNCIYYII